MAKVLLVRQDYIVADPLEANFYDGSELEIVGQRVCIQSTFVSTYEKDNVAVTNPKACTLYLDKIPSGIIIGDAIKAISPPLPALEKAIRMSEAIDG